MDNISTLSNNAINSALIEDWNKAIDINKKILEIQPHNIDALNRLAYAFCQNGNYTQAKKIYKQILIIDKYNNIATKNLDRITILSENDKFYNHKKSSKTHISPCKLIEQPGKTKTIVLSKIAPKNVLLKVSIGNEVCLINKKYSVEVRTNEGLYIGQLPDDIAFRLIVLLKAGNEYLSYIKNIQKNKVSVFLIENKRGKKYANQPSFINKSINPIQRKKSLKNSSKKFKTSDE
jgi:tetratricopeptide (TPR) repeat protein